MAGLQVLTLDDFNKLILSPMVRRWLPEEWAELHADDLKEDPIQSLAYDPERYPHCIELDPR